MYYLFWVCFIVINIMVCFSVDKINYKSKKIIYWIFLFFNALLLALRPINIPDYESYEKIYNYISIGQNYGFDILAREYYTGVEYGYIYLTQLIKIFTGNNIRMYFFVIAYTSTVFSIEIMLNIMSKLNILPMNKNVDVELKIIMSAIFFSYFSMNYQAIAIRQGISMAVCLLSFYFYLDKKMVKAILTIIIAFSIHRMAILGGGLVLVYHFVPSAKTKKTYFQISVIAVFFVLLGYFLNVHEFVLRNLKYVYRFFFKYINYNSYVDGLSMSVSVDRKRILLLIALVLIITFAIEKEKFGRILNIYIVGIAILVFTSNIAGSARIYDYFTIMSVPLLGTEYVQKRKNLIFKSIVMVYMIMQYIVSFRIWGII